MKKGKFQMILYSLYAFTVISCGGEKYIREIPYQYSSSEFSKALQKHKESVDSHYSTVNDNAQGLNDDTLKIKEKYSIIMEVRPDEVGNYKLYSFIDEWLGTPYKKQSFEKQKAIDGSYFVQALFSEVYGETFPKTADGIFRSKTLQLFTGRTFLKEGDIIFFRYDKFHPISDVAVYLHNDRILACTVKGLNIYDFNDEYFQLRYVAAGRLKEKK